MSNTKLPEQPFFGVVRQFFYVKSMRITTPQNQFVRLWLTSLLSIIFATGGCDRTNGAMLAAVQLM
jgi:hypothetical protein